uniref:Ninein n=2 Tax=Varanus komodoensis TaxID=61221 RepID=A0A8D2JGU9_VARKO
MDGAEQDQYEAHLKELFDSFDGTGTGSLGREELTELCHVLHLEEVAPGALQRTLLQDDLPSRVHFDQFKDALVLILSSTLTNEESFPQPDSSPEAQPKYIKGGKRYGRRSMPEFPKPVEEFAEVTVFDPGNEAAQPSCIPSDGCDEHWRSQDSEEYEAEGQLRFWNPDDLNAAQANSPTRDWIEGKLREVCESLGISRDGHLSRKKLVSVCEQYGLRNINTQVLEDIFQNLEPSNSTMSIEDFFYGLFKIGKPLPPSASTPYRQLKRHLSMQAFDESGRRTTTPSAMTSTIGFRVFSSLDDGLGYAEVEQILDAWHEEGIENSHEILKDLDFSLDGKINLADLTLALENELLVAKNRIYQAALASFKAEIRHLMERVDQVVREKEKLRLDLEKAEKLTSRMASEVDDHHAAIERQNEYNLSKLDEDYKERVAALRNELRKDREQLQLQAGKQRAELEQEMEKLRTEENYLRDRLALTLKENSRLEKELLETGEKLVKYESTVSKLQKYWENVLAEKFGDLDPGSAEFFLQEERLMQMKNKHEAQCRELQDQIDELQSQLESFQAQGRAGRSPLKNSLFEELGHGAAECDQEPASEDCNPLNMSIEAEMAIEHMKEQHHHDLRNLRQGLEETICHYEKQLEEAKARGEEEQEALRRQHSQERRALEQQAEQLQARVSELEGELAGLRREAAPRESVEESRLQACLREKASLMEQLQLQHEGALRARLEEAQEAFRREREELVRARAWAEEQMRALARTAREEKAELEDGFQRQLQRLVEEHALEKDRLQQDQLGQHLQELQQQRTEMESEFSRRLSWAEEQFGAERQALMHKYGDAVKGLEERYQHELRELAKLQGEERSKWEFERDEIAQEGAEAQERWGEMLEKEKAVSAALAQERERLEKDFKEQANSLALEKGQLQKELRDMKAQEGALQERLAQIQASHEAELEKRDRETSAMEGEQRRAVHEKELLNSRLASVEHLKQEALRKAAEEERALRAKMEEAQRELQHLSERQRNLVLLNKETQTCKSDSPGPASPQEAGEARSFLSAQEDVPETTGGSDGAAPPGMGKLLEEPARGPSPSPGFVPLLPEAFVDSHLLNSTTEGHCPAESEDGMQASDGRLEGTLSGETMETSLVSEEAREGIWAENEALKRQQRLLQERIAQLEAECDRAAHDRQDMASQVQKELEEILKTIPQPKPLLCGSERSEEGSHWETADGSTRSKSFFVEALGAELTAAEMSDVSPPLEISLREGAGTEQGGLEELVPELWGTVAEKDVCFRAQPKGLRLPEELKLENRVLKAEMIKLLERNSKLEGYLPSLASLQGRLVEIDQESLVLKEENLQLLQKVRELEEGRSRFAKENAELQSSKLALQSQLEKLEEFAVNLKALKRGRPGRSEEAAKETAEVEKKGLHELNRKLKEKIAVLLRQKGTHAQEKDGLNTALRGLQNTCAAQQRRLESLRSEAEHLREENLALKNKVAFLTEEGSVSGLQSRELHGEELRQKVETVQKEKAAVQKMAENLKQQASELKARNQQLELENAELGRKSSPTQAEAHDLNQRFVRMLRQKEKAAGRAAPEDWGREGSRLLEELENCKIQSSALVSSLETELSQLRAHASALEQENHFLKEDLEKVKQLPRCPDLSHLQNKISCITVKNEKLLKEKETLSEELNRCVEKIQMFDDAVQNVNLQMSRLKSDLRVSQQEKEALKQEVVSLHKHLQLANDKNRVLEVATHSAGLQSQQKKLCRDELGQVLKQEQQLLRQENERLQRETQSAKSELTHSRDKVRQLESTILTLKHQKVHGQAGLVKAIEQEKLSLKRECERLQKELAAANRKITQMNSLERELQTINSENEGLRKKQVKLDDQLLHPNSSGTRGPPQPPRDGPQLQQPGRAAVPWDEFPQAERRGQRLQEEAESRPVETNMPQVAPEQLLQTMEKRLMDVERQLRLVKLLLQDKVNQLKEQLAKNSRADEMVKDLYVENAQLLKALEVTEHRQKTAEKKNYLLEEKITNLSRIVKNLTSPTLASAASLGS